MEEKYKEYKKSKMYFKYIITNIFLVLLFILIVASIIKFYLMFNNDKKAINENKNYFYEIKENIVYLNSSDGLEETYECNNECKIYTRDALQGYFNKGKILLEDGTSVYLYDLLNNKKLSSDYGSIDYIFDEEGTELDNIKMFKVKDSSGKQGIIDVDGNTLVNVVYDELGKILNNQLLNYSYSRNYITAKSGDKWGLVALSNGKGLIDFQYDDIKISSYNKLAVNEGNLWTLVDETNKKIINKVYSSIDVYEDYYVVSENNKAFIIDSLGNTTSNKIDLFYPVDPWNTTTIKGLTSEIEEDIIYLYVDTPINEKTGTYKTIKYYYDEENNEIKNTN